MSTKLDKKTVITRLVAVSKNRYTWDDFDYKNISQKINAKCCNGHHFTPILRNLFNGSGCPICRDKANVTKQRLTQEIANLSVNEACGSLYVCHDFVYEGHETRLTVVCNKCNHTWNPSYDNFIRGKGCPSCRSCSIKKARTIPYNTFIYNAINKYGDKFKYDKDTYKNYTSCMQIECPDHGVFSITPQQHLRSSFGCALCSSTSYGEKLLSTFFIDNSITFVKEKRFVDCRDKNPLPFDFYLPDFNTIIEVDGRQHYVYGGRYNKGAKFDKIKKHDKIKNEYCYKNNIKLYRVALFKDRPSFCFSLDEFKSIFIKNIKEAKYGVI